MGLYVNFQFSLCLEKLDHRKPWLSTVFQVQHEGHERFDEVRVEKIPDAKKEKYDFSCDGSFIKRV
jgi:hypothetical protein